ncbi:MAG: LysM peptidoglycan-binding domain-containing protein [Syntrophaceae bacterium]|nr:LysM peptidoglycan-binding domain-containing protein [Syntrophaceae bacterium]
MSLTRFLPRRFVWFCFSAFFILIIPQARAERIHVVMKGESLSTIAHRYQVSISKIVEANDLKDTKLQIDQSLTIPGPSTGASPLHSRQKNQSLPSRGEDIPETHAVKSGDTLSGIARRYGLTVKELQDLNELKGTRLKIGQVLLLKPDEEAAEEAQIQREKGNGESAPALKQAPEIPFSPGADRAEERPLNPLVKAAESFLGVKYRRGGTDVKSGLDCSAFVQKVFQVIGTDLPRTAREQFGVGLEVARDALRIGDLVFFKRTQAKRPAHVGIYIGNDQFIHSSTTKRRIRVDSLNTRYFSTRFIGGRRIQEIKEPSNLPKPERDDFHASLLTFEPSMNLPPPVADPPTIPFDPPDS